MFSTEEGEELKVTFHPPLYLQRQTWVLDILRRENAQSVLDIGCGEGSLLHCLIEPSYTRRPTTSLPPTSPFVLDGPGHQADLYLHAIHGLDPCATSLELLIQGTAPPALDIPSFTGYERWSRRNARWTRLEVNIWEGGFECINEAFAGDKVDVFVAAEVIEHLTPDLFPLFAPVLLGHYRPRLLLLTTPNYTYNQRFSQPGSQSQTGYLDPTGRTDRVFRHSDHKFEWTVEEWTKYCTDSSASFGYSVEIGGVGLAVEPDPWHREDSLGFASHIALFRRLDTCGPPPLRPELIKFFPMAQIILRAKHIHEPHPLTSHELALPPDLDEIRNAAKEAMTANRNGTLTFNDLWKHGEISLKCKGDIGALVRAFERRTYDPNTWLVEDENEAWETKVTWKNYVVDPEPPYVESSDVNGLQISDNPEVVEDSFPMSSSPSENVGDEKKLTDWGTLSWSWEGKKETKWGWHDTNEACDTSEENPWSGSCPATVDTRSFVPELDSARRSVSA